MLSAAPSPTIRSHEGQLSHTAYGPRAHYESSHRPSPTSTSSFRNYSPIQQSSARRRSPTTAPPRSSSRQVGSINAEIESPYLSHSDPTSRYWRRMVDAGTQYSPPEDLSSENQTPTSRVAHLQLADQQNVAGSSSRALNSGARMEQPPSAPNLSQHDETHQPATESAASRGKRPANEDASVPSEAGESSSVIKPNESGEFINKRMRPETPPVRRMPIQYENCDPHDLVILISSMLMELIRYNDAIPLRDGHLTRFHSRAPPGISVEDYLQRLTTHATLSPPILLSMVYYIDRLCALYPAFTISSLTVHRFLITSATVASKGLSDSFWTNKTYARVGGVSMKELALLELEFLGRVEWRIVPRPEVLVDYYRSLIERSEGYELEHPEDGGG